MKLQVGDHAWIGERRCKSPQSPPSTIEADKACDTGKIAACRFFCQDTLPRVTTTRKLVERGARRAETLDLMDLDEGFF